MAFWKKQNPDFVESGIKAGLALKKIQWHMFNLMRDITNCDSAIQSSYLNMLEYWRKREEEARNIFRAWCERHKKSLAKGLNIVALTNEVYALSCLGNVRDLEENGEELYDDEVFLRKSIKEAKQELDFAFSFLSENGKKRVKEMSEK